MARGKAANAPAVFTLLKAAFIGCVVSVALIVIFAALMWKQVAGVELIPIVNAAIKVIGAGLLCAKGLRQPRVVFRRGSWAYLRNACLCRVFDIKRQLCAEYGNAQRYGHRPACRYAVRNGNTGRGALRTINAA